MLNLSSVQSINTGFNDGLGDICMQQITASSGGVIDLFGVETITSPVRSEDRLDFLVEGGSITLGNLTPPGSVWITVKGYDLNSVLSTLVSDAQGIPGELRVVGNVNPAADSKRVPIELTGSGGDPTTAKLIVEGDLSLQDPNTLVLSEGTLSVKGDLQFNHTDEERFKAADSILYMDGNGSAIEPQMLEGRGVGCRDLCRSAEE